MNEYRNKLQYICVLVVYMIWSHQIYIFFQLATTQYKRTNKQNKNTVIWSNVVFVPKNSYLANAEEQPNSNN